MAKFSFFIFTVAVLLGGIAADMQCVIWELRPIGPGYFITDPDRACRNLDTKFDRTRQELKKCLGIEVNISKLENLHHEFCNPNSDYRQKVDRQRYCISPNLPKLRNCIPSMDKLSRLEHILNCYDNCISFMEEMTKCMVDEVGRPCGAEGLEVYERMAEASESIYMAFCFSTKLAALRNLVDEIKEADNKVVEDYHSYRYEVAAATSHSALMWCILVGLLLAARWW